MELLAALDVRAGPRYHWHDWGGSCTYHIQEFMPESDKGWIQKLPSKAEYNGRKLQAEQYASHEVCLVSTSGVLKGPIVPLDKSRIE